MLALGRAVVEATRGGMMIKRDGAPQALRP
jgi:hypothetical protein